MPHSRPDDAMMHIMASVTFIVRLSTVLAVLLPSASLAFCFSGQKNNNIELEKRIFPSWRNEWTYYHGPRKKLRPTINVVNNAHSTNSISSNPPLATINQTNTNNNYPNTIPPLPSSTKQKRKHSLHLLSLPPKNDSFSLPGESLVRECWRWKDSTLGDGRDYFVPRPRALKAFHSLYVGMEITILFDNDDPLEVLLKLPTSEEGQSAAEVKLPVSDECASMDHGLGSSSKTFVVEECAALSNCARLDVILVLAADKEDEAAKTEKAAEIAARHAVAYHLQQQVSSYRSKDISLLQRTGLSSWLDLPGAIHLDRDSTTTTTTKTTTNSLQKEQCTQITQLAHRLTSMEGPRSISTHLSLIAGGLAPRPNRPKREVIFRPYSSRDAHILLQLKRTVEVVSTTTSSTRGDEGDRKVNARSGRGRIKTLLDGALTAGKAARNEGVVPEIKRLKEYGSDGTPPVALANIVAEAAIERAVKPTVAICVTKLTAMETDTAEQISQLRRRVDEIVVFLANGLGDDMVTDKNHIQLKKMANKLLHEPTMRLREGGIERGEIDDVVRDIEMKLVRQISGGV